MSQIINMRNTFRVIVILSICLIAGVQSFSQVDTVTYTVDKEFTTFKAFHYNCHQQIGDIGCLINSQELCLRCKNPLNEQDSILQNKYRGADSLFVKLQDEKGVLRMEYFRPHSEVFLGKVKIYNKHGQLESIESYNLGFYHKYSKKFVKVHRYPIRMGVWKYYDKHGALERSVTYRLLMDSHVSDYHMLVREIKYHTHNSHVKVQKEYTLAIEELELGLKKVKFGKPFLVARGKKL